MAREFSARLTAEGRNFAIVVSRFNDFITSRLLGAAKDAILRHGGNEESIDVVWVPGAWEIPLVAKWLAAKGTYDAIICLGAVIRGDTPHFDVVVAESSKGIAGVSLEHSIPVVNGILTTNSIEQAVERAGTKAGNKGWDVACAAIEMANLMRELDA